MTDDIDPNSHPDQQTFADLFETMKAAARYLETPSSVVDDEMFERLIIACDDAARYYGNEHCDVPPSWLVTLHGLFAAMRASQRLHTTVVSAAHH